MPTGKIVTPGLIESYSQLGLVEIWAERTTVDSQVEEYTVGPSLDVSFAINPASTLFAVNRMGGITRAVVAPLPGADPFAGLGATIHLGRENVLVESRAALFGDVTPIAADFTGGSRAVLLQRLNGALEEAARFNPARYRAEGNDYSRQDMAALKAFLRNDKPLVLHVNRAADIVRCIELAQAHGLRLIILGGAEAWKVGDKLAAAAVTVIVSATANLPIGFDSLGARLDNAALLRQAGVDVLYTGSETHNTRNLRQLAGNAVAHGVPWFDALDALTRKAAITWNMPDAGLLRPGAVGDVVVWSGDRSKSPPGSEQVVIGGELMPMRSRQTRCLSVTDSVVGQLSCEIRRQRRKPDWSDHEVQRARSARALPLATAWRRSGRHRSGSACCLSMIPYRLRRTAGRRRSPGIRA